MNITPELDLWRHPENAETLEGAEHECGHHRAPHHDHQDSQQVPPEQLREGRRQKIIVTFRNQKGLVNT